MFLFVYETGFMSPPTCTSNLLNMKQKRLANQLFSSLPKAWFVKTNDLFMRGIIDGGIVYFAVPLTLKIILSQSFNPNENPKRINFFFNSFC